MPVHKAPSQSNPTLPFSVPNRYWAPVPGPMRLSPLPPTSRNLAQGDCAEFFALHIFFWKKIGTPVMTPLVLTQNVYVLLEKSSNLQRGPPCKAYPGNGVFNLGGGGGATSHDAHTLPSGQAQVTAIPQNQTPVGLGHYPCLLACSQPQY